MFDQEFDEALRRALSTYGQPLFRTKAPRRKRHLIIGKFMIYEREAIDHQIVINVAYKQDLFWQIHSGYGRATDLYREEWRDELLRLLNMKVLDDLARI